jgi:hypothetical protein
MRTWKLRIALTLIAWMGAELTALVGLRLLQHVTGPTAVLPVTTLAPRQRETLERLLAGDAKYDMYSPALGWTIRPGGATALYHANSQGLRATRNYALHPSTDTLRIAAFGDSFTHGDDVPDTATWETTIEHELPNTEVLNFGVGGYGMDQEYLRWHLEGRKFEPQVVLIGYLTENINRQVNSFRPFYAPSTGIPLAKPRFELASDTLRLESNPFRHLEDYRALLDDPSHTISKLGEHDYFYHHRAHASPLNISPLFRLANIVYAQVRTFRDRPIRNGVYNEESEAFAVTTRLFDRFVAEVRAQHATPLIIVFPTQQDFARMAEGKPRGHQALLDYFTRKGYAYVDVLDAFPECRIRCDLRALIPGHFSATGNHVIGEYIARKLGMLLASPARAGADTLHSAVRRIERDG